MILSYKNLLKFLLPWTLLAVGMSLLRISMTDSTRYIWMNWNLFLALIPIFFAWLFHMNHPRILKAIWFMAWLLFLPNAVYMVTDFIHMNTSPDLGLLWYDGMMLFAYALIGVSVSLLTLVKIVESLTNRIQNQALIFFCLSLLLSFGIYLGRYIRWNTWHIITRPLELFGNIFDILLLHSHEPTFYLTIIFFTLFSLVSVVSYKQLL